MATYNVNYFHKALTSNPIFEGYLEEVLLSLTSEQRQNLREEYKKNFGHPIQDDINENLSGKFRDLCLAMFDTQPELDARELHRSLHSFLNDDKTICEIISSRSKEQLDKIGEAYLKFFGWTLKEDIESETSKEYSAFLFACLDTERPEKPTLTESEAQSVAQSIKTNGIKSLVKDTNLFKSIFLEKSREDLLNICLAYNDLEGKSLYMAIKDEASGKNKKLIKNILFSTISPSEFYSKKIFSAVRGLGTDSNCLIRIIVPRSEIDIDIINDYYKFFKNTSIKDDIKDDTSGPFGRILEGLCERTPSAGKNEKKY